MILRPDDFTYLRKLLKERSGLALSEDKAYLVTTRLKPIIESYQFDDLSDLVCAMRRPSGRDLVELVVDAMTTNESLFFRDAQPFEALTAFMLPALMAARGGRPIRIWCAAASTGQEPYSIAILLEEHSGKLVDQSIEIVATDISRAALKRSLAGEYTQFEVGRGMPPHHLNKYFQKCDGNHYTVVPRITGRVSFHCLNLLKSFEHLGQFDIVFCRNVLIYFDRPTKADVLERIANVMPQDGFLVLGGPETTLGLTPRFARHPKWRNVYVPSTGSESTATERICA